MNSFYSDEEVRALGFAEVGEEVLISRKVSIYGAGRMKIGSHVRIDDFCILSGSIEIGNYIHISAYTGLFAGCEKIVLSDFCTISSRCVVYGKSDDFLGNAMTNPMIPEEFTKVTEKPVYIGKHVLIGSGCTVLPGVTLAEGSSFGAMTLINKNADPWIIYFGIPMRPYGDRKKKPLIMEKKWKQSSE